MNESTRYHWQKACAVALSELPNMGPARLQTLLSDLTADLAWAALIEERPVSDELRRVCGPQSTRLIASWVKAAKRVDPLERLESCEQAGVSVWWQMGDYPNALAHDPWAPAVLFWQGDLRPLEMPRVAIVGTRHATREGLETARHFGVALAEAGVSVVSGLALGIDGSAHTGALEASWGAPPIAVVGSGLDVVYPKRHGSLWSSVRERGLLITEAPLGAQPEPWRFPARNRILAALADVVVVVESHSHGGSLITADEADTRGIPVMAVPGSIRSKASRGTNQLIASGCPIATCVDDILNLLPLESLPEEIPGEGSTALEIFEAVDWQPTSTGDVMLRTGLDLGEVSAILMRLEEAGLIVGSSGWWQRTGIPDDED